MPSACHLRAIADERPVSGCRWQAVLPATVLLQKRLRLQPVVLQQPGYGLLPGDPGDRPGQKPPSQDLLFPPGLLIHLVDLRGQTHGRSHCDQLAGLTTLLSS